MARQRKTNSELGIRRENRAGSRGQRKDGRYYHAVWVDGKRRWFYGATQAEADQAAINLLKAREQGIDLDGAATPLGTYMRWWIETVIRVRRDESTYRSYQSTLRAYVLPHAIALAPLSKLTRSKVESWLGDLLVQPRQQKGGANGDQPISPVTVDRVHTTLRSCLRRAVRDKLLAENPAGGIESFARDEDYEEVDPLSAEEAHTLLAAVEGTIHEAFYGIMLSFGLRQGEALGLCWQDVDADRRLLHIRSQLQRGKIVALKRGWHRRTLSLAPAHVALLERHADRLRDLAALAGEAWVEHGLVFPTIKGTPQRAGNNWLSWKRQCERLGLPDRKLHALRHTAASLALDAGVPLWEVSKMLGHKSLQTTADIYGHLVPEGRERIAEVMSGVLKLPAGGERLSRTVVNRLPAGSQAPRSKNKKTPKGAPGGW